MCVCFVEAPELFARLEYLLFGTLSFSFCHRSTHHTGIIFPFIIASRHTYLLTTSVLLYSKGGGCCGSSNSGVPHAQPNTVLTPTPNDNTSFFVPHIFIHIRYHFSVNVYPPQGKEYIGCRTSDLCTDNPNHQPHCIFRIIKLASHYSLLSLTHAYSIPQALCLGFQLGDHLWLGNGGTTFISF